MSRVGDKLATQLYQAALDQEAQLDQEIEELEKLKEDDLEEIRRKRLESMKDEHRAKKNAIQKGCGEYTQLKDEKEFFDEAKKHKAMVCCFFRTGNINSDVMTKHFRDLAKKYWMTRFVSIDAEKCPYLAEKLHIWMLPSCVLIREGKTEHTIRGFDELGGVDFETSRLEAVLGHREMIPFDT